MALFLLDLMHPAVCRVLCGYFSCRDLGAAGSWLEADYALKCADADGTPDSFSCPAGNTGLVYPADSVVCEDNPCTAAECCTVVPPSAAPSCAAAIISAVLAI